MAKEPNLKSPGKKPAPPPKPPVAKEHEYSCWVLGHSEEECGAATGFTAWPAVPVVNPADIPTRLEIGDTIEIGPVPGWRGKVIDFLRPGEGFSKGWIELEQTDGEKPG